MEPQVLRVPERGILLNADDKVEPIVFVPSRHGRVDDKSGASASAGSSIL